MVYGVSRRSAAEGWTEKGRKTLADFRPVDVVATFANDVALDVGGGGDGDAERLDVSSDGSGAVSSICCRREFAWTMSFWRFLSSKV